jgi:hypothetical protein
MAILASTLVGRRTTYRGYLFELPWNGQLSEALVRTSKVTEWGKVLHRRLEMSESAPLEGALAEAFGEDSEGSPGSAWPSYWSALEKAHQLGQDHPDIIRKDWPRPGSGRTLYLYATRQAGFAIMVEENLATLRSSA